MGDYEESSVLLVPFAGFIAIIILFYGILVLMYDFLFNPPKEAQQ